MRKFNFYLFIFILFISNSYSQSDLVDTWYLDHIIKAGVIHNNYYNDDIDISITYTNTEFSIFAECEPTSGTHSSSSDTISINNIVQLAGPACGAEAYGVYKDLFLNVFSNNNSPTSNFSYTITGINNDQVLTMTNIDSGDSLVFTKVAPSILLVTTWYLHHIDIPGNPIINIPNTDTPTLTLTNSFYVPLGMESYGIGDCNSFSGYYMVSFNGADHIQFNYLAYTLVDCNSSSYESEYFSILETDSTNFFEFEISNDGLTLILTDLLGARLIYGDAPLSLEEFSLDNQVSLNENPVANTIDVKFSEEFAQSNALTYSITSITGKLIKEGILNSNEIPVDYLRSGIYFLKLNSGSNESQVLKFIKQ